MTRKALLEVVLAGIDALRRAQREYGGFDFGSVTLAFVEPIFLVMVAVTMKVRRLLLEKVVVVVVVLFQVWAPVSLNTKEVTR
jgi:hypothetical protein